MPIFQSLGNDVEYDDVSKALIVRRSQDNVVMELYTDTGIVKADGAHWVSWNILVRSNLSILFSHQMQSLFWLVLPENLMRIPMNFISNSTLD